MKALLLAVLLGASTSAEPPPTVPMQEEGLTKEGIRATIRSHRDGIRHCYEVALEQDPQLSGLVKVSFDIGADGVVARSEMLPPGSGSAELDRCVVQEVRSWHFPKPKGGGIARVTYPFVFKHAAEPVPAAGTAPATKVPVKHGEAPTEGTPAVVGPPAPARPR